MVLSPAGPALEKLARATGGRDLYVALYPYGPQQERIRFSRRAGLPLAAVTPVYFLDPADFEIHRLLRAIGLNTKLDRVPPKELAPDWAWLKPPERWIERYLHCPEALKGKRTGAWKKHHRLGCPYSIGVMPSSDRNSLSGHIFNSCLF